ncbi:MAG: aminoglycoside phosphotransferase family protein [Deltaproteobacteria bacterium]|nr:aminoglycoside phosphotransferase family protein [Deltaproteobacteria bacterium]
MASTHTMQPGTARKAALVRELTGAREVQWGQRIQTLWGGYGEVVRVQVDGAPRVVKHVRPPLDAHPRKLRSYEVERAWYEGRASRCTGDCRVPRCLGTWSDGSESLFVLEDLDAAGFSGRRRGLAPRELRDCLRWLARFHATFLGESAEDLWPVGTYWHLATRPDELRAMSNAALRREAPELDARLRSASFQTLVHGDAKPANFCFGPGGVAAVDFQYVGGGPGIKDVAYLLWGARQVDEALDVYFAELRAAGAGAAEDEWRSLFVTAQRDFERFRDGWGA